MSPAIAIPNSVKDATIPAFPPCDIYSDLTSSDETFQSSSSKSPFAHKWERTRVPPHNRQSDAERCSDYRALPGSDFVSEFQLNTKPHSNSLFEQRSNRRIEALMASSVRAAREKKDPSRLVDFFYFVKTHNLGEGEWTLEKVDTLKRLYSTHQMNQEPKVDSGLIGCITESNQKANTARSDALDCEKNKTVIVDGVENTMEFLIGAVVMTFLVALTIFTAH
mmetsp:Transcript_19681/g.40101  ORF Transcript_19681/g.40101 Transcript_19681/m.40101 type:complete len:222 (-) Transcript_19681:122-787(-)|eukprot:CAMPEP_0181299184 /NCGR_PEP_ID=MMETSP1101-20121128/6203_1 /TAXON_ID=46948 /ORGANISM="Rhodomonas abbreviata, Strain Caron Lab Isolate" /LENGTH=221 /DNA_ID=CAMNT_0023404301 /DNA_START=45 /DNA_END=710 /DNA_ORIENTATION=-